MLRLPVLAFLVATLWTGAPAAAQQSFRDADFEFSFELPDGLQAASDEQIRQVFGMPADMPLNPGRTGAEGERLSHRYLWYDTAGRGRSARLIIEDLQLPFTRADEFADYIRTTVGEGETAEITEQKALEPPTHKAGLLAEVKRTNAQGQSVHIVYAYYPMGRERFALLTLQGLPADWKPLRKAYLGTLATVAFQGEQAGTAGGTGKPGSGRQPPTPMPAPGRRGKAGASEGSGEDWSSLEVSGSLALAMVLLAGLFVAGRRS